MIDLSIYPMFDDSLTIHRHAVHAAFREASEIISLQHYVEIRYSEYNYINSPQTENMNMSLWCITIIMHALKMPLT